MTTPNLYDFATKELSQDATIAYILAWADPKYRNSHPQFHDLGTKLLRSLLLTQKQNLPIIKTLQIETQVTLRIKTQVVRIDILVRINMDQNAKRIILIIEDKVSNTEHSNQIKYYKKAVKRNYKGLYDHLVAVYLKTENKSGEELPSECGHFLRRDLLNVLDRFQDTQNTIVDDFRTHLQRREYDINRMESGYYKNDTVTEFVLKVADSTIGRLPDAIRPESKSQFAHDYGYRSYSLWHPHHWSKVGLYYEIGISPSEDKESCTSAFVAIRYEMHGLPWSPGEGTIPYNKKELISLLKKLNIQKDQRHEIENSEKGRIGVNYGENELNDAFAETLANTLRRFIKVVTPAVDAFVNERNEEDA